MTIPRNLSFLAEGASSTGVLGTANGGTGQTSLSSVSVGTSTNLAGGSAGVIPFQTGSGATSFTAAGTSGQVLTSAGSGTPTWSTPSAGAMTLISTQTASASSSIIWTGLSTYDKYMLIFGGITVSSTAFVIIQIGYGSTPTYNTNNYQVWGFYANNSTTGNGCGGLSSAYPLVCESIGNFIPASGNALFTNFLSNNSTFPASMNGLSSYYDNSLGYLETSFFGGTQTSHSGPVTSLKILTNNSATLTTGSFSLYGISS